MSKSVVAALRISKILTREYTHLLCKEQYQCMVNLLFELSCFAYVKLTTELPVWSNLIQSNSDTFHFKVSEYSLF